MGNEAEVRCGPAVVGLQVTTQVGLEARREPDGVRDAVLERPDVEELVGEVKASGASELTEAQASVCGQQDGAAEDWRRVGEEKFQLRR